MLFLLVSGCWFAYYSEGGCREYDKVKIPGGKMHGASLGMWQTLQGNRVS